MINAFEYPVSLYLGLPLGFPSLAFLQASAITTMINNAASHTAPPPAAIAAFSVRPISSAIAEAFSNPVGELV
jgi:hypothetical protein